jgi:drug/metabolite transporter (DMT)-like permease
MFGTQSRPALKGAGLALIAAALFGFSSPLIQFLGQGVGAFGTASLLYGGAALLGFLVRQPVDKEAQVRSSDLKPLLAMAVCGAVIGPVALAWGLQRTSGVGASLMLSLEAVFTALLAWRIFHETMDRRVWAGVGFLILGAIVLVLDQGQQGASQWKGLLAVFFATLAWGFDNTISRSVADRDPGQVVLIKSFLGAAATACLALALGEPRPSLQNGFFLVAVGAVGYGLSLRFYLLAQRAFGAARTGSVFAFAPFIGALLAFALGERAGSYLMILGSLLMLTGVLLHLVETHGHEHFHASTSHEHRHRHDDGHHDHTHQDMPKGFHSHAHDHEPRKHAHAHVPDAHHDHRH